MRLDKASLKRIQAIWQKQEEGLDLIEFLKVMYAEVACEPEERMELIYGAIKIFKDVDINGDGNMSWNEFVQNVIDQVESTSVKPEFDGVTGKEISIAEQLEMRELTLLRRFQQDTDLVDNSHHRKWITSAHSCKSEGKHLIVCCQERSAQIQIYDTRMR